MKIDNPVGFTGLKLQAFTINKSLTAVEKPIIKLNGTNASNV